MTRVKIQLRDKNALRKEMIDKNITMKDLAEKMNISLATLYYIFSEKRYCGPRTASKIANAFGYNIDEIFNIEFEEANTR